MMRTGFARLCITPPLGIEMAGYYESRQAKGVLDDLYVQVAVFDDGEKKAAVISLDSLMFASVKCDGYRKAIAEATGLDAGALFIACTHTHTGPIVGRVGIPCDEYYETMITTQMCDAVNYALADMKESKFSVAEGLAERVSFIRRFRMKDGKVQTNPGVDNPNIDHPLGEANDAVKLLKIEREGGDDIYIVNFGTHADTVGGDYISADYPGFVRKTIEMALPGVKCIFLNGAEGDANHINPNPTEGEKQGLTYDTFDGCPRGYEHTKHMGRAIAGAVLQVCGKTTPIRADKISYGETIATIPSNAENDRLEEAKRVRDLYDAGREAELPYKNMELTTYVAEMKRICSLANGPDSFSYALTVLSLGDFAFAGLPGEPFVEIGRRIEKISPYQDTFVCSLTNGGDTYFPTSSAYDEGGYETKASRLKKGGDNIVVSAMEELLKKTK